MKSLVFFRLPQMSELNVLGNALASVQDDAPLRETWTELYSWYAEGRRACSFSSFARSFMFTDPQGFVSANLISDQAADCLEESRDWRLLFNLDAIAPLSDDELAIANGGPGSTLMITSLFWRKTRPRLAVGLADAALGHLTRWFEGNLINSVCFCLPAAVGKVIEPALEALNPSSYRLSFFSKEFTFCRVHHPWQPTGVGPNWFARLLGRYPEPTYRLSREDMLIGRSFHECEFDIWAAIQGSLSNWTVPGEKGRYFDDDKLRSSSANQWRTRVGLELMLNPEGGQRVDTMRMIADAIRSNPRLLTLE